MSFDFSTPYVSARLPLFARNIVSTSHPLAAQAGLRMMLKGGNAVDAAIAAAAALTLTEPVILYSVGWQQTAWPECFWSCTSGLDP
jgi:gamma-glutamyltranspeptidase/glutathione hydrolase